MEKRSDRLTSTNVYVSLNRLIQVILDSVGRGEIIVAECDSGKILEELSSLLDELNITPHIYKPEKWEDIRKVWIEFKDNPNWGIALWRLDRDTPVSLYREINFNRDAFLDAKWPSVFWVSSQAIKQLIKEAPDFWRYRAAYISFPAIPKTTRLFTLSATSMLRETPEEIEEIKQNISSLKRLLKGIKNPVRSARFLAEMGKLELKLFRLTGNAGYLEDSMRHLEEAVAKAERRGLKDLFVAQALNDLGYAYYLRGEYHRAIEFLEKALEIQLKVLGKEHPDSAATYSNLGLAYADKGDYEQAIEFYKKALEIQLEVLGYKHPDTAKTFNNLGSAYYKKGELDRAIEFFNKALGIYRRMLGEEHLDTAMIYNNLGNCYFSKGENDKAVEFYKKALQVYRKVLGDKHPTVKKIYENLNLALDKIKSDKPSESLK